MPKHHYPLLWMGVFALMASKLESLCVLPRRYYLRHFHGSRGIGTERIPGSLLGGVDPTAVTKAWVVV